MKAHLLLDVDDVVANLMTAWLEKYNAATEDTVVYEDVRDWDITKSLSRLHAKDIFGLVQPGMYRHVQPLPYARTAVRTLRSLGHRVTFVTSCINNTAGAKEEWLRKWGFLEDRKDFIAASDKSLIRGDLLVDDAIHNVESFPGFAVLVSRPWNLSANLPRIPSIASLPEYVSRVFA